MNRKLRNSLSAVTASGAALAIALMVAVPAGTASVQGGAPQDFRTAAGQHEDIDSLAQAVALSARLAAASALAIEANGDMDAQATQRSPRKGLRHRRQTIVMPYFSFSPRG